VSINTYKVIYNLIDDVKAAMEGKLRSVEEKQPLGEATVSSFISALLGCFDGRRSIACVHCAPFISARLVYLW
jgi:translation initiation factor IF-2